VASTALDTRGMNAGGSFVLSLLRARTAWWEKKNAGGGQNNFSGSEGKIGLNKGNVALNPLISKRAAPRTKAFAKKRPVPAIWGALCSAHRDDQGLVMS